MKRFLKRVQHPRQNRRIIYVLGLLYALCVSSLAQAAPVSTPDFTDRFLTVYQGDYFQKEPALTTYWINRLPRRLEDLIVSLPFPAYNFAAYTLMINVIADIPAGEPGNIDAERVYGVLNSLMSLGAHHKAVSYYQLKIGTPPDEKIAIAGTEAMLLANEIDAACVDIQLYRDRFQTEYWEKADILCQFMAGQNITGATKFATLKNAAEDATEDKEGELYLSLGETLSAETAPDMELIKSADFTPLTLSMLLAHGQNLPEDISPKDFSNLPAEYIVSFATARSLPQSVKLRFAETALKMHVMPPEHIGRILSGKLPDDVSEKYKSLAKTLQDIQETESPEKKTKLIESGIKQAGGPSQALSHVFLPELQLLEPNSSHISLAIPATIMLYGIGAHNQAVKWADLITASTPSGEDDPAVDLKYLVASAIQSSSEDKSVLSQWFKTMNVEKNTEIQEIHAMLSGLGVDLATMDYNEDTEQNSPDNDAKRALIKAARKKYRGETALLGLELLGENTLEGNNFQNVDLGLAKTVLLYYVEAGLIHEARAIALETIARAEMAHYNNKEKNYGSSRSSTPQTGPHSRRS